jgi:ribosomal protein L29
MKKKDLVELRAKEIKVIKETLAKKKLELATLVTKSVGGGEKNLRKGKNLRKDIAQILTVIKEKELIEEIEKEEQRNLKTEEIKN